MVFITRSRYSRVSPVDADGVACKCRRGRFETPALAPEGTGEGRRFFAGGRGEDALPTFDIITTDSGGGGGGAREPNRL